MLDRALDLLAPHAKSASLAYAFALNRGKIANEVAAANKARDLWLTEHPAPADGDHAAMQAFQLLLNADLATILEGEVAVSLHSIKREVIEADASWRDGAPLEHLVALVLAGVVEESAA
jgi:hypothetical protein